MEQWKDIEDYEGLYQVSDLGNVKSLKFGKEKILKPFSNARGYFRVELHKNGNNKQLCVHRLVYEAFNGKTDLQVDHIIEGNKSDNRLCNLQAMPNRDNVTKYKLSTSKSSQYIGVCWEESRKKWRAQILINGKSKYIGRFTNEFEAHQAYQKQLLAINKKELTNSNI